MEYGMNELWNLYVHVRIVLKGLWRLRLLTVSVSRQSGSS